MRPELQAKLLQHLNKKNADQGFTLVELLVVIVIIGILAAVALPNFLSQSAKAKQAEAKQNVAIFARGNTSYRSEKSQFAPNFNTLAVGSLRDDATAGTMSTASYSYTMAPGTDSTTITTTSTDTALKQYGGSVTRYNNSTGDSESVVASVVCEANAAGAVTGVLNAPIGGSAGTAPSCNTSNAVDLKYKK